MPRNITHKRIQLINQVVINFTYVHIIFTKQISYIYLGIQFQTRLKSQPTVKTNTLESKLSKLLRKFRLQHECIKRATTLNEYKMKQDLFTELHKAKYLQHLDK